MTVGTEAANARPLRVALIGTRGVPARYGGAETWAQELTVRLAARGHDVTVYCRHNNVEGNPSEYRGVHLEYAPCVNTKALSTLTHSITSLASAIRRRFDVLLVFNAGNAPMLVLARAAGQKVAINVDGQDWRRGKWGRLERAYYQAAELVSSRMADRVIVDSVTIGDYYADRWDARSTYIGNGAPLTSSRDPSILETYGLERGKYVLMTSRLEPENNAALLVDAWKSLGEEEYQLVIAGITNWKSGYVRDLAAAAADAPGVHLLGGVYAPGHIDELLCGCYVYVHGNEVGGTSPGLLQALGSGACVLSIDVDINREVGSDNMLYYQKDPDELARLLKTVISDPQMVHHMRATAQSAVTSRYDWDVVTERYERLLVDVTEGRVGRSSPRD
jgi:glycosyltransferase involved in cell wall biosynthesis